MYRVHMINQLVPLPIVMNTLLKAEDNYAVNTQSWKSSTRIQMRNQESNFKAKVASQYKNSQLLGFLSVYMWKYQCLQHTEG